MLIYLLPRNPLLLSTFRCRVSYGFNPMAGKVVLRILPAEKRYIPVNATLREAFNGSAVRSYATVSLSVPYPGLFSARIVVIESLG